MNILSWIAPRISWRNLGRMARLSVLGAAAAGVYGVIHDQVTFSISPEYFTRFKFYQFAYAEPPGDSPRVFAGIIGFLATWWVGALIAWVLARVSLLRGRDLPPVRDFLFAFLITFSVSFLVACGGYGFAMWRRTTGYAEGWLLWLESLAVEDIDSFMTVGYIHNSSYFGGVLGTFVAIGFLRRRGRRENTT